MNLSIQHVVPLTQLVKVMSSGILIQLIGLSAEKRVVEVWKYSNAVGTVWERSWLPTQDYHARPPFVRRISPVKLIWMLMLWVRVPADPRRKRKKPRCFFVLVVFRKTFRILYVLTFTQIKPAHAKDAIWLNEKLLYILLKAVRGGNFDQSMKCCIVKSCLVWIFITVVIYVPEMIPVFRFFHIYIAYHYRRMLSAILYDIRTRSKTVVPNIQRDIFHELLSHPY